MTKCRKDTILSANDGGIPGKSQVSPSDTRRVVKDWRFVARQTLTGISPAYMKGSRICENSDAHEGDTRNSHESGYKEIFRPDRCVVCSKPRI